MQCPDCNRYPCICEGLPLFEKGDDIGFKHGNRKYIAKKSNTLKDLGATEYKYYDDEDEWANLTTPLVDALKRNLKARYVGMEKESKGIPILSYPILSYP